MDAPRLSKSDASGAVQLWWEDKTHRPQTKGRQQVARKEANPSLSTSVGPSTSTEDGNTNTRLSDFFTLDDWEAWLT